MIIKNKDLIEKIYNKNIYVNNCLDIYVVFIKNIQFKVIINKI